MEERNETGENVCVREGDGKGDERFEEKLRGVQEYIPRANSHETRPFLFALVRCQARKQCGPRTEAEKSNGTRILNTLEYLLSVSRSGKQRAFHLFLCTYGHVTDCFSNISHSLLSICTRSVIVLRDGKLNSVCVDDSADLQLA